MESILTYLIVKVLACPGQSGLRGHSGGANQVEIPVFLSSVFLPAVPVCLLLYFGFSKRPARRLHTSNYTFSRIMATDSPIPANLLSAKNFERRAARWATFITKRKAHDLHRIFQVVGETGQEQRLTHVDFPVQHLEWLVSTVGVRNIQVRFLVAPARADQNTERQSGPHFTLALYATDALGARISAFYLPIDYWKKPQKPGVQDFNVAPTAFIPQGQAPHSLVKIWVNNWTGTDTTPAPEIRTDMFANSYGPLQGYAFSLDDFMEPLFEAQKFTDEEVEKLTVRISFALHEYYPATGKDKGLKKTFGLVLRLDSSAVPNPLIAPAPHAAHVLATSMEPFFDLSTPCPPGYESAD
jgi:hypothetical protein